MSFKRLLMVFALFFSGSLSLAESVCRPVEFSADYRVVFDSIWSKETHPHRFPKNPHFSGLTGGVHNTSANFWLPGEIATNGIERMAERGGKALLKGEVQRAVRDGQALGYLSGGGIPNSPGQARRSFTVNAQFPLVTLVSMLAPSPDWFVGVHGLTLCENDEWVKEKVVELYVYDAGTDSGKNFRSGDRDTNPREFIQRLDFGNFLMVPVGTFTFIRKN